MEQEGGSRSFEGAGASAASIDDTVVEGRRDTEEQQQQADNDGGGDGDHAGSDSPRGAPAAPSSFRAFDRSGINKDNPFQSNKRAIFGVKAGAYAGGSASNRRASGGQPADRYAEREAARRREREDELYFNAKYALPTRRGSQSRGGAAAQSAYEREADEDERHEAEEANARSDADYAFLRRTASDLPLHRLNSGQRQTARELAEEDAERGGRARESAAAGSGGGVRRSASATRASDEELLSTIDYLERFLSKSKHSLTRRRSAGPEWARQLEMMGGPERAGRVAAALDRDELFGRDDELDREEEEAEARAGSFRPGYAAPTVSSSPFGRRSPLFAPAASRSSPGSAVAKAGGRMHAQENELVQLENQVADLRRQAAAIDPLGGGGHSSSARSPGARDRDRDVEVALDNIRQRAELERSIAYLEDYTQGRRPLPDYAFEDEMQGYGAPQSSSSSGGRRRRSGGDVSSPRGLFHSASERLFSPSHSGPGLSQRIPSSHPHRTGKNHRPSSCVYCQREVDWNSWNTDVIRLAKKAFPDKAALFDDDGGAADAAGHGGARAVSPGGHSRLRPLARRMHEASKLMSPLPISRDVDAHFLAQLSASERRRQSKRLDTLWYMIGAGERDKKAQLVRIAGEIEAEQVKRAAHLKWIEEQAIERTLKRAVMDRAHEREVARQVAEQSRQVARLLELKRQSLANYARDQLDLVAERARIERETERTRRQNDAHSLREMQRQVREATEQVKQRQLDRLRHSEEKYSFRISQLKRPVGAQRGISDLAYWKSGRE